MANIYLPTNKKPTIAIVDHQNMVIQADNKDKVINYHALQKIFEVKYKTQKIIMCDASIPIVVKKLPTWEKLDFTPLLHPTDSKSSQPTNADNSILECIALWRHEAEKIILLTDDGGLIASAKKLIHELPPEYLNFSPEVHEKLLKLRSDFKNISPRTFFYWRTGDKRLKNIQLYIPKQEIAHKYTQNRKKWTLLNISSQILNNKEKQETEQIIPPYIS